ncbi:hypothetical protein LBMAG42_02940 [Deltaproteobacteria bacterium]|nr:hypothetical protein LBMAG42_02940 [Deltaproteobacteria bacterium]
MSASDPGPWSPRRAVALFVAAAWIVSVVAAWGVLRVTLGSRGAGLEGEDVAQQVDRIATILDVEIRRFEDGTRRLAIDPEVEAWASAGGEVLPPSELTSATPGDFLVVSDARGAWRFQHVPEAFVGHVEDLQTGGLGARMIEIGGEPVLVVATAMVGGGQLVAAHPMPMPAIGGVAASVGLDVSLALGGRPLLNSNVVASPSGGLLATRVIRFGDGLEGITLEGRTRPHVATDTDLTFRRLLLGFAMASGALGIIAMRWLPRVFHRESDRLYSEFVERSGEGILLLQPDTLAISQANTAVGALLGRTPEELIAMTLPEVLPMSPAAVIALRGLIGDARAQLGEVPYGEGEARRHLDVIASQMVWRDQDAICVMIRDVTARHAEAERNRHLAWHDPLTGLPNRSAFQDRLRGALTEAAARGEVLGVAFVDVDQFKNVNDIVGHDVADRLLVDVATRLREGVRGGDVVARQGGDEFLLLLPNLGRRADAAGLAERVLAVFRSPFVVEGREIQLTASIGIAVYPDDGRDASELVKHADMAMFQAKEAGRDGWQLYDGAMRERTARLVETRTRLTHALERGEFLLHYQPQVDLRTGEIVGVEALIRWMCDGRMVPPMEFIPVAEQTGLIGPIGAWVIHEACRQAQAWQDAGLPPVRMAVNLSARQFLNGGVVEAVDRALSETGLDPRWLEVEITESLAMRNAEVACKVLESLQERGVTVALDDFGTGYSSLAYLRQFPIDRLKIDRAFLAGATNDPEQRALVGAIIMLAHAINMEVVAEGIESAEQFNMLLRDGCDIGQGFGLSRPVAAEEVGLLLANRELLVERLLVSRVA